MDNAVSGSIRRFLRDATERHHSRVDRAAAGMRLDTREGYTRFLAAQAAVIVPLEAQLQVDGVAQVLPDWRARKRAAAIEMDLMELGSDHGWIHPPFFANAAQLLGACYVLEGSRLGARAVLAKLGRTTATRFLEHGQGARLWPSFLAILETHPCVHRNPALALDAADAVFALFESALTEAAGTQELAAAS
jgi:heme oxygenase